MTFKQGFTYIGDTWGGDISRIFRIFIDEKGHGDQARWNTISGDWQDFFIEARMSGYTSEAFLYDEITEEQALDFMMEHPHPEKYVTRDEALDYLRNGKSK